MKNYRYSRMSLSFVNFVLVLIAFAFLLPSQGASSVYGQENERCENNRRVIKDYKRQVDDLNLIGKIMDSKVYYRKVYEDLQQVIYTRGKLAEYSDLNRRKQWGLGMGLEWDNRWDKDQMAFQKALRTRLGQLLDETKRYTDLKSIERVSLNLQKRIKEHETNLKALNCGGGVVGGGGQCGLGKRWIVAYDGPFSAEWTRIDNTNQFTGKWQKGNETFAANLTITIQGNSVTVIRTNSEHPSKNCKMTGTLSSDGVTVTGTNVCNPGVGDFRATIKCNDAPK